MPIFCVGASSDLPVVEKLLLLIKALKFDKFEPEFHPSASKAELVSSLSLLIIDLLIYLFIDLIYSFINLYVYLFIYLFICLFIYLFIDLLIY